MNFRSLKLRLSFYCNCLIIIIYYIFRAFFDESKIQNKNGTTKFFLFQVEVDGNVEVHLYFPICIIYLFPYYLCGAADEVLAVGVEFAAEPAGAAVFEGLKEKVGLLFQCESVAGLQVIEGEGAVVGVVVGIVAVQGVLNLLGHGMRQRDAASVFLEQHLEVGREEIGMGDEQLAVFLLPFVAMGLYILVFQMGLEVGGFVKEYPEEEVGVEVAVDGDFMESMVGAWAAIIAEFGGPFEGDVEVDFVAEEISIDPIHRR